jgi:hypothetical protein
MQYNQPIRNISQNPIITGNLQYFENNEDVDDLSIDVQTLFNTVINTDLDMGSTYRYSVAPYTTDLNLNNTSKKHKCGKRFERFETMSNQNNQPIYIHREIPLVVSPFFWDDKIILFFCMLFMVLTFILLINKSCEKDCLSF